MSDKAAFGRLSFWALFIGAALSLGLYTHSVIPHHLSVILLAPHVIPLPLVSSRA
jgi:hypothetical protein